jgi:molybdopterin/thiamine biosynthesis adenylyltransferase
MKTERRHVVVAGAGNTGSHLLPLLARMSEISRITICDPEFYEPANLAVQCIDRVDLDRPKVEVQAEKLRRIRPALGDTSLEVIALQERVEDAPRGLLDCDLFISCLPSRISRLNLNEIAWRLDTPWFDCGVLASQNLVRVSAYAPAQDAPCLECAWGTAEYSALEQQYLCASGDVSDFPAMSTATLGSLAASLLAVEIKKFFARGAARSLAGRQIVFDAEHHVIQMSALRRNPYCRFDHRSWRVIEPWICLPAATTVGAALSALGSLQVEGHRFACELVCPGCGHSEKALRLNRPLAHCPACNRRMVTSGFGALDRIDATLVGEYVNLTLAQIGIRVGDIVSGKARHHRIQEAA